MTPQRGPHYSQKCPFHITKDQPLSAKKSVAQCVECVSCGNQRLQHMKPDLYQIAYLTILESSPKYNPDHQSGASYATFIRSRVCGRLWAEKKKHLKSIPFPALEAVRADYQVASNPLVDGLIAAACQCEGIDDTVAEHVDLETFKATLPQLLACLSKKEGMVLKLKFFKGYKAVEIAKMLQISEGRVSQLSRSALTKLKQTFL